MVFFFALMTKEVVEATAPGGVLHPWRRALLPVIAAIGATLVPALIYVRAVDLLDEPMLVDRLAGVVRDRHRRQLFRRENHLPAAPGDPVPAAPRDRLRRAGVPGARAVQSGRGPSPRAAARLHHGGRASRMAFGLRRARVKSFWPYLLAAGGVSWFAFFWSGLHPALALVPIVPFLPHAARDPGFFVDAPPTATDALSQFEIWWRYPAQVALFFFGLVNAGVPLHALEPGTWGLPIAVIVGKPLGILLAAGVALAAGLHLPQRVGWRELVVVGFTAAIGFSIGPVLLHRAAAAGPAALGNQHGRAAGLAGSAAGARRPRGCCASDRFAPDSSARSSR